jgi:hypothetical protein
MLKRVVRITYRMNVCMSVIIPSALCLLLFRSFVDLHILNVDPYPAPVLRNFISVVSICLYISPLINSLRRQLTKEELDEPISFL